MLYFYENSFELDMAQLGTQGEREEVEERAV